VSRKISGPIQKLRQAVRTIGGGNLEHRAEITTGDELEDLAQEFNDMTEALQTSYATLEEKVKERTEEPGALYEVTTAVNKSLDLQTILRAVIDKITGIFQFETTRIFLFNAEMEQMDCELRLKSTRSTGPKCIPSKEVTVSLAESSSPASQ
jgi:nitrate/nitrite-specific signal transduction histidine kinase